MQFAFAHVFGFNLTHRIQIKFQSISSQTQQQIFHNFCQEMIAWLISFNLIHYSFIFIHGWLLSNRFHNSFQFYFCPSFRHGELAWDLCKALCKGAIMQHNLWQTGQEKFWYVMENSSLCSHPLPDVNDQCTKWKSSNETFISRYEFSLI